MDGAMVLGTAGTSTLAVGVTVVATLVIVALLSGLVLVIRAGRELRRTALALSAESAELLAALDEAVRRADGHVRRVDDLVGSAESISEAVGTASRLASTAMAGPVIKVMAFGAGAARAGRRLRDGPPPPPPSRGLGSGRRRPGR